MGNLLPNPTDLRVCACGPALDLGARGLRSLRVSHLAMPATSYGSADRTAVQHYIARKSQYCWRAAPSLMSASPLASV